MQNAIQAYHNTRTANATGFTVEQVETINECERAHQASYDAACRAAQRCEPVAYIADFAIEYDARIGMPRVDWHEDGRNYSGAVRADGSIDFRI